MTGRSAGRFRAAMKVTDEQGNVVPPVRSARSG